MKLDSPITKPGAPDEQALSASCLSPVTNSSNGIKLTFQMTNPVNDENGQNLHSISVLYHTQETLTQKLYQNKHGWKVAWHNFD